MTSEKKNAVPSWVYYLSPAIAYALVFIGSYYLLNKYFPRGRPLAFAFVGTFARVTMLEFWGFVDIVKGALVLNTLTGSERLITQGWSPLIPIIEQIRPRADRDLGRKTVQASVFIPTLGVNGGGGPEIVVEATLTYQEKDDLLSQAIKYDEKTVKTGAEAIIKETVQAEVAQTKITEIAMKWPDLKKTLKEKFKGDTEDQTANTEFEKRYGFVVESADISYKNSPEYQKTLNDRAAGDELLALAKQIFKEAGGKEGYTFKDAMDDAKVTLGKTVEKKYTGSAAAALMEFIVDKENNKGKKGGK